MAEATTMPASPQSDTWANTLWTRRLHKYPSSAVRYWYLAQVVMIAVVLYYVYWEEGATLPLLLPYYHMTFRYFLLLERQRIGDRSGDQRFRQSMSFAVSKNATARAS